MQTVQTQTRRRYEQGNETWGNSEQLGGNLENTFRTKLPVRPVKTQD